MRAEPREACLTRCVKCGHDNIQGSVGCEECTWPFTRGAWASSRHRIRRVTLDTGCVNSKGQHANLNFLEGWAAAGLIELQRSDVMLQELQGQMRIAKATSFGTHPGLFTLGTSTLDGPDVLAGPDLSEELRQILFQTANPLTDNQRHDIEHLRLHVRTGGDVFVTLNPNDFVTRGRQEALSSLGIWVLSPAELVELLRELYGWQ